MTRHLRFLLYVLCLLLGFALPAGARTMYVIDELVITLRQNPANSSPIVGRARSLEKMEVIEEGEEWILVRNADGVQGWVQSKYISEDPPIGLKVKQMEAENERLLSVFHELEAENARLKELNAELDAQLKEELTSRTKLEEEYRRLGEEAADYLKLRKEYEEARNQLTELKAETETLARAADETVNNRRLRWFLAGAGVLVTGWLVGLISLRRKRSPSRFY
jgi:SH3 domain protein